MHIEIHSPINLSLVQHFGFKKENILDEQVWYLLIEDDVIVACLCYEQFDDECHITNGHVDPKYRRHGYWQLLLARVVADLILIGTSIVTMQCNQKSRVAAMRLGFKEYASHWTDMFDEGEAYKYYKRILISQ